MIETSITFDPTTRFVEVDLRALVPTVDESRAHVRDFLRLTRRNGSLVKELDQLEALIKQAIMTTLRVSVEALGSQSHRLSWAFAGTPHLLLVTPLPRGAQGFRLMDDTEAQTLGDLFYCTTEVSKPAIAEALLREAERRKVIRFSTNIQT